MDAADGLTHVAVGGRGDRAGIEHYQVRLVALRNRDETFVRQESFEGSAIGLCCAASEILNEKVTQPLFYRITFRR
jgi:hypothetical protein